MKQTIKPSYETPVSEEFRMDVLVLQDYSMEPDDPIIIPVDE